MDWIDPAPAIARRVSTCSARRAPRAATAGAEMIFTSNVPHAQRGLTPFFGGRASGLIPAAQANSDFTKRCAAVALPQEVDDGGGCCTIALCLSIYRAASDRRIANLIDRTATICIIEKSANTLSKTFSCHDFF